MNTHVLCGSSLCTIYINFHSFINTAWESSFENETEMVVCFVFRGEGFVHGFLLLLFVLIS